MRPLVDFDQWNKGMDAIEASNFEEQSRKAAELMRGMDWTPFGITKEGHIIMVLTDPWKHRSKAMTCSTCMWYVRKKTDAEVMTEIDAPRPPDSTIGRCRRHAPTMNGYPVVFETDWCGDHKLDENKI